MRKSGLIRQNASLIFYVQEEDRHGKHKPVLGTERVGKLMRRYAVPCIISLLVGALYNIVDQIFIANASYLGSYGNAANTVVFPLTVVALAIAVMIGDAAARSSAFHSARAKWERQERASAARSCCRLRAALS